MIWCDVKMVYQSSLKKRHVFVQQDQLVRQCKAVSLCYETFVGVSVWHNPHQLAAKQTKNNYIIGKYT